MKIFTLSQLKEKFNAIYEKSANPKFTLENELKEIMIFVDTVPKYRVIQNVHPVYPEANNLTVLEVSILNKKLFKEAFYGNMQNGDFIEERFSNETDEVYQIKLDTIKQAKEYFEYYKWLNEINNIPQKTDKKNTLFLNQKILVLDYLGVDLVKYDKTKMAKILSSVLGMSEQNIRECLTYINVDKNETRTKANLETILQLFENQGINDISSKIKKDLNKL